MVVVVEVVLDVENCALVYIYKGETVFARNFDGQSSKPVAQKKHLVWGD